MANLTEIGIGKQKCERQESGISAAGSIVDTYGSIWICCGVYLDSRDCLFLDVHLTSTGIYIISKVAVTHQHFTVAWSGTRVLIGKIELHRSFPPQSGNPRRLCGTPCKSHPLEQQIEVC